MFHLLGRNRAKPPAERAETAGLPAWARPLFASALAPRRRAPDGDVLVWAIEDDASLATISDQFKAHAEDYHLRYAASDHFEALFNQGLAAAGISVRPQPVVLDLGSGSGVNSVVPCRRIFAGARVVATDLSGELLEILARYLRQGDGADDVVCVVMDAMSDHVAPGSFDVVTGASILHHLERPAQGLQAAARALRPGGHAIFFEPFNGWSIIRLAYERILAEAELRKDPLEPAVAACLSDMIADIAARSNPDPRSEAFSVLDDKWLFSRTRIEAQARAAGFSEVFFVPHNDHATLYRDVTTIQLRLATGRPDLALPDWATQVLDGFDAALTLHAKRELMLEGTIVLTKPGA